ncbi:MAG: dicarboxylate/amino acid:cation symporter [Acidobacteria bacterium]|nr:dicarboxylate/amino acid:cation symporter [Acidobacteriota bacterium]
MSVAPWYRHLHWQVAAALALGIAMGLIGGETAAGQLGWLGTLFVRLLRMIVVPLVFASIVSGVVSAGGGSAMGRLFSKTLGYYLLTSMLAIVTGLVAVNLIKPGVGASFEGVASGTIPELTTPNSVLDLVIAIVPENVVAAAATGDMLALIFFSIVLGVAITTLPEAPRQRLVDFFDAVFQAMMRLTQGVIVFLPIGVFALITRLVGESGLDSFLALGLYMVTIVAGLSVHLFITLPLVLILLGGISPRIHFANMFDALMMAFSTSSSAATLPLTMQNVEQKAGVSNRVSSFVLPLGATVNMDGTALYECAGVIFITQALGVDLGLGQQMLVVFTALLASIGTAAIPSAGLVMIFIILGALNLRGPEVDVIVAALIAVDRPLDMLRTATNVFSDSCGAAIIARSEGETNVDVSPR